MDFDKLCGRIEKKFKAWIKFIIKIFVANEYSKLFMHGILVAFLALV